MPVKSLANENALRRGPPIGATTAVVTRDRGSAVRTAETAALIVAIVTEIIELVVMIGAVSVMNVTGTDIQTVAETRAIGTTATKIGMAIVTGIVMVIAVRTDAMSIAGIVVQTAESLTVTAAAPSAAAPAKTAGSASTITIITEIAASVGIAAERTLAAGVPSAVTKIVTVPLTEMKGQRILSAHRVAIAAVIETWTNLSSYPWAIVG